MGRGAAEDSAGVDGKTARVYCVLGGDEEGGAAKGAGLCWKSGAA